MTPKEAAEWMVAEIAKRGELYQKDAYTFLSKLNDPELAFISDEGSERIGKKVLAAFNKLTPDLVYERSERLWRPRQKSDYPRRQQ